MIKCKTNYKIKERTRKIHKHQLPNNSPNNSPNSQHNKATNLPKKKKPKNTIQ